MKKFFGIVFLILLAAGIYAALPWIPPSMVVPFSEARSISARGKPPILTARQALMFARNQGLLDKIPATELSKEPYKWKVIAAQDTVRYTVNEIEYGVRNGFNTQKNADAEIAERRKQGDFWTVTVIQVQGSSDYYCGIAFRWNGEILKDVYNPTCQHFRTPSVAPAKKST